MIKFEVGKRYFMKSICNSNCVWQYEVLARTNCTITIKDLLDGTIKKCRITNDSDGYERVRPLGRYSMSPSLIATKEIKDNVIDFCQFKNHR